MNKLKACKNKISGMMLTSKQYAGDDSKITHKKIYCFSWQIIKAAIQRNVCS